MTSQIVKKVIGDLKNLTTKQSVRLAVGIISGLREETPKDTSWASANWLGNVGEPRRDTIGSPESISLSGIQEGINAVSKYKFGDGDIIISNNVPYIQKLNNGHSKKAPKNFVESVVSRELNKLK